MIFGQVITAMVTPFDKDLSIDYNALEKLIEHLIATGSDTLLVAGTTGESPTLSDAEKLDLFRACKEIAGKRAKIMAGTGSNSTIHSVEFSQEAEKVGVDCLLVVSPYYNKPTQEGLYRHFKAIADAVDIPVVPYNIPGRTAVTIEPETLARLAEIKNIVAVKDAVGNLEKTSKTRLLAPNLEIYSGDDSMTLPMLALGGQGVISVASHVVGSEIKQMITSFKEGKTKEAEEIHLKLFELFKALFVITNPIPVKAALNLIGIPVGGLRLPLCEADEKTVALLKSELKKLGKIE